MNQVATIDETCRSIMHLQPFEEHYQNCVESLMDSAKNLDRAQGLDQARAYCLRKGLRDGGSDFDVCELQSVGAQRAETASNRAAPLSEIVEPGGSKSYPYASPHDVFRREQLSCARLGFDPADGGFGSCVAGLQGAMFEADNPEN